MDRTNDNVGDRSGLRIVVVDDDELSRYVVARRLQRWGYETVVFGGAEAALAYLRDHAARALVSDVYMPGTDGVDLSVAARALQPELPVVLMSANPDPRLVERARAEGIEDCIAKQAGSEASLRQAIEKAVANAIEKAIERGDDSPEPDFELAHSLRTPLTALKSSIDILCRDALPDPQRRLARIAQRNVDELVTLVEKLLGKAAARS